MKTIKSVLQGDWDRCFFPNCQNPPTQVHHVMHGNSANKRKAEEDGLLIHVCATCHEMIHFDKDASGRTDRSLKRLAQIKWEESWKARNTVQVTLKSVKEVDDYVTDLNRRAHEAWLKRYGRSYL